MIAPENIRYLRDISARVERRMFGLGEVTGALIAAIVSGGHVLLEGNPGLGKTALVRALAGALGFRPERVGRIQFTPDLMPADITGTLLPEPTPANPHALAFRPGPIFHWLLLADEINRATPKTQSAMLEAMAERQVTVLGETYPLAPPRTVVLGNRRYRASPPFMVMATQNPIDHEGTYDLPEAQADRFMFKIRMPFPDFATLGQIVDKETGAAPPPDPNPQDPEAAEDQAVARLHEIAHGLRRIALPDAVRLHVLNIVLASTGGAVPEGGVPHRRAEALRKLVGDYLAFPLGPRTATALALGARGWAVAMLADGGEGELQGHAADALARIAVPALRHRLKLRLGWRRAFDRDFPDEAGRDDASAADWLAGHLCTLAAPGDESYASAFREAMDVALVRPL